MTKSRTLILVSALSMLLVWETAAGGPPTTVEELAGRPELWPQKVTVRKDIEFSDGTSIKYGQVFKVQEIRTADIVLNEGSNYFPILPEETDIMERLSILLSTMTPEQIDLTPLALRNRSELWPLSVMSKVDMSLEDGVNLPAVSEFNFRGFNPDGSLVLYARESGTVVAMDVIHTDLMARARERLALPADRRTPFFIRSLESMLEPAADGSTLADSDFLVLYEGRNNCPRSRTFAPQLATVYGRAYGEKIDFEVVHLAAIDDRQEHQAHLERTGLAARISQEGREQDIVTLTGMRGEVLPYVYLMDHEGNVLAHTSADGMATSPRDVLAVLEQRLSEQFPGRP